MPPTNPGDKSDFQPCLESAYRFLSLRPRSEFEVRSHLKKRGCSTTTMEKILGELRRQSFLDDSSFAHFWTENRQSFSPRSRAFLRLELRRKGIDHQLISEAIQGVDDEENAYRAARKKIRRPLNSNYQEYRRAVGGFLRRRGFSYDVCQRVLARIWLEELETP